MADSDNHRIRRVRVGENGAGVVTTVAGSGASGTFPVGPERLVNGTGGQAVFNQPFGLAVREKDGRLYVADSKNSAIRVLTWRE